MQVLETEPSSPANPMIYRETGFLCSPVPSDLVPTTQKATLKLAGLAERSRPDSA